MRGASASKENVTRTKFENIEKVRRILGIHPSQEIQSRVYFTRFAKPVGEQLKASSLKDVIMSVKSR